MRRKQPDLSSSLPGAARTVMVYEVAIAAGVALFFFALQGGLQALSALYGGLITLIMTLLLRRRVTKLTEAATQGAAIGAAAVGVMLRFLWVLLLFGLGFAVFKFDPLASIVGFGLAQLGYVIAMRKTSH
ncbi:MAG: ATP synthase subunit I [Gammaproteobacteria bacterium]|nr:ATP synthase subunit I [Gammaproteobacteria bacterium]